VPETPDRTLERRVARVVVDVMLKPEILDPAGQAVAGALPRLGVTDVASVRIGKRIEIDFTGQADLDRAREIADRLLANPVIEDFTLRVEDTPAAEVPTIHATLRQLPAGTTLVEARPVEPEGESK
jgi:phosphoribosylformylglycinamidine synthase PurS subunit